MTVLEWLFWLALGTLGFVYFGYYGLLELFVRFGKTPVRTRDWYPSVSIVVCAYNEEQHIEKKIRNCMELDYPPELVEIIIMSDGSTDATDSIVRKQDSARLRFHAMPERVGKTECQNVATQLAKHDVLFFTDATTMHPAEALKILVRGLADPDVGCVTGRPIFERDEGLTSEGLGKRESYELKLRLNLSHAKSLLGAQDCMYAVPRHLYCPVRMDLDSGFVGPLKILEKGYRTVYEPEALAYVDRPVPTMKGELIRRSRIVLRGMRGLLHMRRLMNPFRYGFVAISLIATRLLRWMTPVFLLVMFIANLGLLESSFYKGTLLLQVAFYSAAIAGVICDRYDFRIKSLFALPLFFCLITLSAAVGIGRLLCGDTGQIWQTRRS